MGNKVRRVFMERFLEHLPALLVTRGCLGFRGLKARLVTKETQGIQVSHLFTLSTLQILKHNFSLMYLSLCVALSCFHTFSISGALWILSNVFCPLFQEWMACPVLLASRERVALQVCRGKKEGMGHQAALAIPVILDRQVYLGRMVTLDSRVRQMCADTPILRDVFVCMT